MGKQPWNFHSAPYSYKHTAKASKGSIIFFGRGPKFTVYQWKCYCLLPPHPPFWQQQFSDPLTQIHLAPKQVHIVLKSVFSNKINYLWSTSDSLHFGHQTFMDMDPLFFLKCYDLQYWSPCCWKWQPYKYLLETLDAILQNIRGFTLFHAVRYLEFGFRGKNGVQFDNFCWLCDPLIHSGTYDTPHTKCRVTALWRT